MRASLAVQRAVILTLGVRWILILRSKRRAERRPFLRIVRIGINIHLTSYGILTLSDMSSTMDLHGSLSA